MTGRTKALAGAVVCLAQAAYLFPRLQGAALTPLLITFAALVLVPLLLDLLLAEDTTRLAGWILALQLPAGILLATAQVIPRGAAATFAVLPWVALTSMLAVAGLTGLMLGRWRKSLGRGCDAIAMVFAGVGGLWVLADRTGVRPLNLDREIVALTAVHFHYAGLILPVITGFVIERNPTSRAAVMAAIGVILGVPSVAIGIALAQIGWGPAFETAAGCGLAVAGMMVGFLQARLALEPFAAGRARVLLAVAGGSLFVAMFLALMQALGASAIPVPRLDPGAMLVLYGLLDAVGFGLCGVLGWRCVLARRSGSGSS